MDYLAVASNGAFPTYATTSISERASLFASWGLLDLDQYGPGEPRLILTYGGIGFPIQLQGPVRFPPVP